MSAAPDPAVAEQIDALDLRSSRPLIITDADEVLFRFMAGLEAYLEREGYEIRLDSFAITGNVRERATGTPVTPERMRALLDAFFAAETANLEPVPGAAEALAALAREADIVVLSNIPLAQREARAEALARHGMPYPLIANSGLKGAAARSLAARAGRPVVFLDDIPHNLASVNRHLGDAHLIHFVADPRLRALVPAPEVPHHPSGDWAHAHDLIARIISAAPPDSARTA